MDEAFFVICLYHDKEKYVMEETFFIICLHHDKEKYAMDKAFFIICLYHDKAKYGMDRELFHSHKKKSFQNFVESNQNQSENDKYNLISVDLARICCHSVSCITIDKTVAPRFFEAILQTYENHLSPDNP